MPPDRASTGALARSLRRNCSSSWSDRGPGLLGASCRRSGRGSRGCSTPSATGRACWTAGTTPMSRLASAGWATTSMPPTSARPLVGITRVVSMPAVVVLPAPFGPSRPKISPRCTVRSSVVDRLDVARVDLGELLGPDHLVGRSVPVGRWALGLQGTGHATSVSPGVVAGVGGGGGVGRCGSAAGRAPSGTRAPRARRSRSRSSVSIVRAISTSSPKCSAPGGGQRDAGDPSIARIGGRGARGRRPRAGRSGARAWPRRSTCCRPARSGSGGRSEAAACCSRIQVARLLPWRANASSTQARTALAVSASSRPRAGTAGRAGRRGRDRGRCNHCPTIYSSTNDLSTPRSAESVRPSRPGRCARSASRESSIQSRWRAPGRSGSLVVVAGIAVVQRDAAALDPGEAGGEPLGRRAPPWSASASAVDP